MMHNKKIYFMGFWALCSMSVAQAQVAKQPQVVAKQTPNSLTLSSAQDSLSYALGVDIARSLKSSNFEIDLDVLSKALTASYQGKEVLFNEEQVTTVIQRNIRMMMEKRGAELRKPGEEFLAALKNKSTVKSTPEGVLYEVLVEGTGSQPNSNDEVKVHYAGYLINGEKFDSSYDRGEPINLNLNQVIEGWKIALPLMKVGAKYKLYIPYNLAYGERDTGKIPPYSALIFEIELLDIIKPDEV